MISAKTIGKIALSTFIYIAVFDVVGVLLCLFLDIVESSGTSAALYYAVWFVLGVFCGLLSYSGAKDLGAPKVFGVAIIFVTLIVMAGISVASYLIWWRYGVEDSYFVPDSEPLTLTFFVTILASSVLAHRTLGSAS
jgi:hypothetical protein